MYQNKFLHQFGYMELVIEFSLMNNMIMSYSVNYHTLKKIYETVRLTDKAASERVTILVPKKYNHLPISMILDQAVHEENINIPTQTTHI